MLESTALGTLRFMLEESKIRYVRSSVLVILRVFNAIRVGETRRREDGAE